MSREETFMDRLIAGEIGDVRHELDDEIDRWHEMPEDGRQLHTFLGFSREEYALFLERPEWLRIFAKRVRLIRGLRRLPQHPPVRGKHGPRGKAKAHE
jgi:hypothetical protein